MKRWLLLGLVLTCFALAQAQSSGILGPNQKSPSAELEQLEALIASAKQAGSAIDPALVARMNELIPLIKGHPSKAPATAYRSLEDDGFGTRAIIRPQELSPLEQQIQELELQLMNGLGRRADDVTFQSVKEQLNLLYAQRPINREHNSLDQGADTCPGTVVTGVPYTDSGTTVGRANNYGLLNPGVCPNSTNSNDVVYSFTAPFTGTYTISLDGSSYDTYLWINSTGACPGTVQVACDDDGGTGVNSLLTLTLFAGTTYYIIVDGYSGNVGAYMLHITSDCNVDCLPTDVLECAGEFRGAGNESIDCDGGCEPAFFGGVESWQDILPFTTVCGRSFTYVDSFGGNRRDADAYRVTLTEACSLAITIRAEFGSQIIISAGTCPWSFVQLLPTWSYSCSTATYITSCLQPGSYGVVVLPTVYQGLDDLYDYRLRVDLIPCSGCRLDGTIAAPGSVTGNTCGAGNDCGLRNSQEQTYAVVIPYASDWTFSLCNSNPNWDPYIYLTQTCCGSVITQNDDGCGYPLSTINCYPLSAGVYYLTVEGFIDSGCGEYELNVVECLGSCCYGDPGNPACGYGTQSACITLGGQFTLAEPCSTGACYTRPTCDAALSLYSQLPALPDEDWNAFQSDQSAGWTQYEDFSVDEDINSLKFWGLFLGDASCATSPQDFEILFIDSVNNVTQSYNVTLTGTVLPAVYWGAYQIIEFTTFLPTPCTIRDGWVHIVETNSATCHFYWSVTVLGNGIGAYENYAGGTPYLTTHELAFCLGSQCAAPDSVTVELYPDPFYYPDAFTLRWWQPAGNVVLWWSNDPNAVFPTSYSPLVSGYLTEGRYEYSFFSPDVPAYEMVFVVTMQCAPLMTMPEEGDLPVQVISSPFALPTPTQR